MTGTATATYRPVTVQLSEDTVDQIKKQLPSRHYATVSEYLRSLIRADLDKIRTAPAEDHA
jgi:Arc/MetJ-type ribon-helix-helix transcriptional regulator